MQKRIPAKTGEIREIQLYKSENNPMPSFGLIEENMELFHTD